VRKNWRGLFGSVPDFKSDLLNYSISGDTTWSEWRWHGTRNDGAPFDMRGVIIMVAKEDRFSLSRLYIEPFVQRGEDIDAFVKSVTGS
jgi:hypothetical protein